MRYLRENKNAYTLKRSTASESSGPDRGWLHHDVPRPLRPGGRIPRTQKLAYWHEGASYVKAIGKLGYRAAFLSRPPCLAHKIATTPRAVARKLRFHLRQWKIDERKDRLKRTSFAFLLRLS
jgi:hypothetical protein